MLAVPNSLTKVSLTTLTLGSLLYNIIFCHHKFKMYFVQAKDTKILIVLIYTFGTYPPFHSYREFTGNQKDTAHSMKEYKNKYSLPLETELCWEMQTRIFIQSRIKFPSKHLSYILWPLWCCNCPFLYTVKELPPSHSRCTVVGSFFKKINLLFIFQFLPVALWSQPYWDITWIIAHWLHKSRLKKITGSMLTLKADWGCGSHFFPI